MHIANQIIIWEQDPSIRIFLKPMCSQGWKSHHNAYKFRSLLRLNKQKHYEYILCSKRMVISINKIRLVCYKCNMHFLPDCHQMLRLYLWWSGVKHSSCGLSKTKFTGREDGVFGTSERDLPPFILKMPVGVAMKRIRTHISAMQYQAWSYPYTAGFTLHVLSEHFTWENGEVIYIIYYICTTNKYIYFSKLVCVPIIKW